MSFEEVLEDHRSGSLAITCNAAQHFKELLAGKFEAQEQFLRDDTFRSGQLVALGQDLTEFAAALELGRHALIGHDWGARAAYIASTLNEANIGACVTLSTAEGMAATSGKDATATSLPFDAPPDGRVPLTPAVAEAPSFKIELQPARPKPLAAHRASRMPPRSNRWG